MTEKTEDYDMVTDSLVNDSVPAERVPAHLQKLARAHLAIIGEMVDGHSPARALALPQPNAFDIIPEAENCEPDEYAFDMWSDPRLFAWYTTLDSGLTSRALRVSSYLLSMWHWSSLSSAHHSVYISRNCVCRLLHSGSQLGEVTRQQRLDTGQLRLVEGMWKGNVARLLLELGVGTDLEGPSERYRERLASRGELVLLPFDVPVEHSGAVLLVRIAPITFDAIQGDASGVLWGEYRILQQRALAWVARLRDTDDSLEDVLQACDWGTDELRELLCYAACTERATLLGLLTQVTGEEVDSFPIDPLTGAPITVEREDGGLHIVLPTPENSEVRAFWDRWSRNLSSVTVR